MFDRIDVAGEIQMTSQDSAKLHGIFSIPVYIAKRDSDLTSNEEKDISSIVKEGMGKNTGNSVSENSYIFNDKLEKIKEFCEQQLKIYVEQVIVPKKEVDFYITQSWLNITKPGEYHHLHTHQNSIISGVFYIAAEEDDKITFSDPNTKLKGMIKFEKKAYNTVNSDTWWFPSIANELVLFPSWLNHQVNVNEKATKDRISISFNTFVKGNLGSQTNLTELLLR